MAKHPLDISRLIKSKSPAQASKVDEGKAQDTNAVDSGVKQSADVSNMPEPVAKVAPKLEAREDEKDIKVEPVKPKVEARQEVLKNESAVESPAKVELPKSKEAESVVPKKSEDSSVKEEIAPEFQKIKAKQVKAEVKKEEIVVAQPIAKKVEPVIEKQEEAPKQIEQKAIQKNMIKTEIWQELNSDCQKLVSSKCWKDHDLNPLFSELKDLGKISTKWLNWAIPTFVNGMEKGPIKEWVEGNERSRGFHEVLVEEHQKYRKALKKSHSPSVDTPKVEFAKISLDTSGPIPVQQQESNVSRALFLGLSLKIKSVSKDFDSHIEFFKSHVSNCA